MRYLLHFILVFILILLPWLSLPSKADTEKLQLVTGEYPPFTSEEMPGGGIVTEIVTKVFSLMKFDLAFDYLPWKRGYVLTKQQKYAATYPYLLTEERSRDFLYSDPIVEWKSKVYVRADSGIKYDNFLDLTGLTECIPHHYGGLAKLDKMHSAGQIRRMRPPHIKSCWLMVLNGRADFFVEDVFVADIFRRNVLDNRFGEIVELEKPISFDYGYLIFPKSSPKSQSLISQFNQTLKGMRQRREVAELKEQFIIKHAETLK